MVLFLFLVEAVVNLVAVEEGHREGIKQFHLILAIQIEDEIRELYAQVLQPSRWESV
jgi:hypothetical protein